MLDRKRLEEFIEHIRLTPAIWKNEEFGIPSSHLLEIWEHFGHTFDITAKEAEHQWEYLIRLHRLMNPKAKSDSFRIGQLPPEDAWTPADTFVAQSLSLFLKPALDELLLISTPSESSV